VVQFLAGRFQSFRYALDGLRYVIHTQKNAWIHAMVTAAVIFLGLWLVIPASSWAIIFVTIGVVWMAECLNTAVETLVDLVSPGRHPLAKIAKDVSAAGVLVTAICAVLVGLILLLPSLLSKLF
jgi:diacylglycerol kinase (ATP)